MAKRQTTYEGIKITVITSANCMVTYFNHPTIKGRQYSLKMQGPKIVPEFMDQAIEAAKKEIRKILQLPEPVTEPTA